MGYRNKTYIVFDGDNDMWAYGYMTGWKVSKHIDFDFHDAHDLKPLTDRASEGTVRQRLRERFLTAKHVIVLVGEQTRRLYRLRDEGFEELRGFLERFWEQGLARLKAAAESESARPERGRRAGTSQGHAQRPERRRRRA